MSILVAIGALAVAVACCALLSPQVDPRGLRRRAWLSFSNRRFALT